MSITLATDCHHKSIVLIKKWIKSLTLTGNLVIKDWMRGQNEMLH